MPATEHAADLTIAAARAAADKKAEYLAAIDVSERLGLTDVFLLASGTNERHVHAIVDAVDEAMHRAGAKRRTREVSPTPTGCWWTMGTSSSTSCRTRIGSSTPWSVCGRTAPLSSLPADLTRPGGPEGGEEDGQVGAAS